MERIQGIDSPVMRDAHQCETNGSSVIYMQSNHLEDFEMKRQTVILLLSAVFILAGCDISSPDSSKGELKMYLVDSPAEFDQVNIVVDRVDVLKAENDTASGWITVNSTPATYDLLKLRNGVSAVLGSTELEPGWYNQIRLLIGSGNNVVISGVQNPLTIPSGSQTGIKLIHRFEIVPGQTAEMTLDFDASRSVHRAGLNYMLKPTIRIQSNASSGSISGTVVPVDSRPRIWTLVGSDTVGTFADVTSGSFKLMALPEGTYSVRITPTKLSYRDTTIAGVNVVRQKNVSLGNILLGTK